MRRPSLPESISDLIWTLALSLPAMTGFLFIFYFIGSEGVAGRAYPRIYPWLWLAGVALATLSLAVRHRRVALGLATLVFIASQLYGLLLGD